MQEIKKNISATMNTGAGNQDKTKDVFLKTVWLSALSLFLFTIIGFCGKVWWIFELFSHFRVQYFVLLSFMLLIFLFNRHKLKVLLITIFVLVNLCLILPLYHNIPPSHAQNKKTYRLISYNVHHDNDNYKETITFIKQTQPDIVLLVEPDKEWIDKLSELKAIFPFFIEEPLENSFGIALYSRLPLINTHIRYIVLANLPSIAAEVYLHNKVITIIGTHTLPPISTSFASIRNQQLKDLALIASTSNKPFILAGDLNITSWSPYFQDLIKESRLYDSQKGFGIQPTWPTMLPPLGITIDHCLISSDITIINRKIGRNLGSDHHPVIIDFSI